MIQIAVLGYGTIGSGVAEVLKVNKESITKRVGDEISIKYILDRSITTSVRASDFTRFISPRPTEAPIITAEEDDIASTITFRY